MAQNLSSFILPTHYHQNHILLIDALKLGDLTVDDLLDHAVCDTANRDCMMQACAHCPGTGNVYEFLKLASSSGEGDDEVEDDELRYKQWMSADWCQLNNITETRDECLKSLSREIKGLLCTITARGPSPGISRA